jgi:hypothetical protein
LRSKETNPLTVRAVGMDPGSALLLPPQPPSNANNETMTAKRNMSARS